jgi:hypothetical protein
MSPKRSTWLVVALAGALGAGCGSSSNSTSSSQAAPTPPATAAKVPTGQQAVELCKHSIQVQPSLSASAKAKLEKTCGKAATGGQAAMEEVAKRVCVELVNASHVPAGQARERALAVCNVR